MPIPPTHKNKNTTQKYLHNKKDTTPAILSLSCDQNRGDQPLSVEEAGSEKKTSFFSACVIGAWGVGWGHPCVGHERGIRLQSCPTPQAPITQAEKNEDFFFQSQLPQRSTVSHPCFGHKKGIICSRRRRSCHRRRCRRQEPPPPSLPASPPCPSLASDAKKQNLNWQFFIFIA